jgi:hypothetical protein
MRIWHRVALAAGSLAVAVVIGGCQAVGTGQPTPSSSGSDNVVPPSLPVTLPSSVPPVPPTATDTPPPPAGTGVTGRITVDGGCPVITDKGCPDRPYPARITVTAMSSTRALATVLAAKDGTYRIALAPGTYQVHVANPEDKPFPRSASVTVTVAPGRYATANVRLDSGIR